MRFGSKVPGSSMEVRDVNMDFAYGESFTESSPEAYERLILDVLIGDPPLFPRQEEVELSWRILDPIEEFWAENAKPDAVRVGHVRARVRRRDDGTRRPRLAPAVAGQDSMTIDLTDTTTGAIDQALTEARRRLGGMTARHGAHAHHRRPTRRRSTTPSGPPTRRPRSTPAASWPSSPARPKADSAARRRDPGRRATPARRDDRAAHVRPARRSTPTRSSLPLLLPGRAGGDLVAGRSRRRSRPSTRSARSPSAGSPTRRPPRRRASALAARAAAYQPGDTDFGWTRATPWRSLLAATLDQPHPRGHRGRDRGRGGQPDRGPDRRLAVAAAGGPRPADRLRRPRDHRGPLTTTDGDISIDPRRRPHGHAGLAGPDRPHGRPAPPGHRRAARRGAAPAGPRRGLRGDAGTSTVAARRAAGPGRGRPPTGASSGTAAGEAAEVANGERTPVSTPEVFVYATATCSPAPPRRAR